MSKYAQLSHVVRITYTSCQIPPYMYLLDALQGKRLHARQIGIYRQILKFRLFRNHQMIKTYFTVIMIICGISLCQIVNKYNNTKRGVFINLSKYYFRLMPHTLVSNELLFTLIDTIHFSCYNKNNFLCINRYTNVKDHCKMCFNRWIISKSIKLSIC